jgi:hypothetical protein
LPPTAMVPPCGDNLTYPAALEAHADRPLDLSRFSLRASANLDFTILMHREYLTQFSVLILTDSQRPVKLRGDWGVAANSWQIPRLDLSHAVRVVEKRTYRGTARLAWHVIDNAER